MTLERPLLLVLTPSLRISGGNKEIVRLVREVLALGGVDVVILSMWRVAHEVDTEGIRVVHLSEEEPQRASALSQLPAIARAFRLFLRETGRNSNRKPFLLLSHYSTYMLGWLAPGLRRICFNQDTEWLFVPEGWRRRLLKSAILATSRRSCVITTNDFVTQSYLAQRVKPFGEASIWAEPQWLATSASHNRDIDVLMLLRSSGIKRLDLYREALELFCGQKDLRVAVITPDPEIAHSIAAETASVFLRPTDNEMAELYARSRVFLLLSDVEGFGLPPLEAMGSGCVAICRDSGGVRCYMHGQFAELLFPLDVPVAQIVRSVCERLRDARLPTSDAAQQAFADGLQASQASRADCIRRLHNWLLRPARP